MTAPNSADDRTVDPLQHYLVTIAADGSITVDGSQPVSADTRAALP